MIVFEVVNVNNETRTSNTTHQYSVKGSNDRSASQINQEQKPVYSWNSTDVLHHLNFIQNKYFESKHPRMMLL